MQNRILNLCESITNTCSSIVNGVSDICCNPVANLKICVNKVSDCMSTGCERIANMIVPVESILGKIILTLVLLETGFGFGARSNFDGVMGTGFAEEKITANVTDLEHDSVASSIGGLSAMSTVVAVGFSRVPTMLGYFIYGRNNRNQDLRAPTGVYRLLSNLLKLCPLAFSILWTSIVTHYSSSMTYESMNHDAHAPDDVGKLIFASNIAFSSFIVYFFFNLLQNSFQNIDKIVSEIEEKGIASDRRSLKILLISIPVVLPPLIASWFINDVSIRSSAKNSIILLKMLTSDSAVNNYAIFVNILGLVTTLTTTSHSTYVAIKEWFSSGDDEVDQLKFFKQGKFKEPLYYTALLFFALDALQAAYMGTRGGAIILAKQFSLDNYNAQIIIASISINFLSALQNFLFLRQNGMRYFCESQRQINHRENIQEGYLLMGGVSHEPSVNLDIDKLMKVPKPALEKKSSQSRKSTNIHGLFAVEDTSDATRSTVPLISIAIAAPR